MHAEHTPVGGKPCPMLQIFNEKLFKTVFIYLYLIVNLNTSVLASTIIIFNLKSYKIV